MSIYESLKQLIYPQITIWESHIVTIIFSSTMATIAAYFIIGTYKKLHEQKMHEIYERKQARSMLVKAYEDLENKIEERTEALKLSNLKLSKEIEIRRLTENKLRRSEEKFSKVFHNAPLAIGVISFREGRFLMVNDHFINLMECDDKDQVYGKTIYDIDMLVDDSEWIQIRNYLNNQKSNPFAMETRIRTTLGEVRNIFLTADQIELDGNNHILIIFYDTTKMFRKYYDV